MASTCHDVIQIQFKTAADSFCNMCSGRMSMLLKPCLGACCEVLSHRLHLPSSCWLGSRRLPHESNHRQTSPQRPPQAPLQPTAAHFRTQRTALVSILQQNCSPRRISSQLVHQMRSLQVRHCGVYMNCQY